MAGSSSEKAHLLSDGEWLVNMIRNRNSETIRKQPRIGRVSRTLREFKSNETCFNPSVVSLGPYHHHNELLKPMERCKEEAAIWFVSQAQPDGPDSSNQDDKARKIYHHFATEATCASPLKDWYVADESTNKISDEDFMRMMFLDGCFILYFIIDKVVLNRDRLMRENHLHELLIVRDMFLLENQIPYIVLKVLSGLMPSKTFVDICIEYCIGKFFFPSDSDIAQSPLALGPSISIRISPSNKTFSLVNDYEPFHLLDILKFKFTGGRKIVYSNKYNNYYFRSIMEHKAAGIKLRRSQYNHLKGISFEESLIFGYLSLPPITVNKETKSWVLNLIAYEMSPDLVLEPGAITTCINFLVSLIQHADDVKELRSKEILLNHLGSDEEVAKLFNEMGNNLMSKLMIYDVMADIQKHYGYKCKGLEREVAEGGSGVSEDAKKESIMRLSWGLVHSRRPEDVQRGVAMLEASLNNSSSLTEKREKLYLLAVGHYRSGDYARSRQLVERCLEIAPDWRQGLTLKKVIEDKTAKDGLIGIGIAATAVGLLAGGIAAAVSRKK